MSRLRFKLGVTTERFKLGVTTERVKLGVMTARFKIEFKTESDTFNNDTVFKTFSLESIGLQKMGFVLRHLHRFSVLVRTFPLHILWLLENKFTQKSNN